MKRIFWGLIFLPLAAFSQGQQESGFRISGNITGLKDKTEVSLSDANNIADTAAKALVQASAFVLKGHLKEPGLYQLTLGSAQKKTLLFVGNDKVGVKGSLDDLKDLQVTGSPSHDDFVAFQKMFGGDFGHLNALNQFANSPEGATKRDSVTAVYSSIVASIQSKIDQFIEARKGSFVSSFALVVVSQLSDDAFLLERRLNSLSPEVQNGYFGKYLREQVDNGKIGAVGTDEIDFTQKDTLGNPVTLSSFKGKYVLVDFWASWCHPCRMENPHVVEAFHKFKDKNFTVLGVSLDRDRESWIKAIHDDNLTWSQVSDLKFWNNEVVVKYRIQQIPTNLLIDPNGKIVGKNLRGAELDAKLCALLGCN